MCRCREGFELYDEEHKGEVSFETCRVLLETMGDTMRVEEIKDQFVVIGKDPKEMKGVTLQDFIGTRAFGQAGTCPA